MPKIRRKDVEYENIKFVGFQCEVELWKEFKIATARSGATMREGFREALMLWLSLEPEQRDKLIDLDVRLLAAPAGSLLEKQLKKAAAEENGEEEEEFGPEFDSDVASDPAFLESDADLDEDFDEDTNFDEEKLKAGDDLIANTN